MTIQDIKQRFGIIGSSPTLERDIDIAMQVAPTDLSVLITGESGTGKEVFPQIIHQLSARKHGPYIAVNCGAIPEGTIDSELFGHEKGSFTGAHEARKGYFEGANGGTIFLDEVAEMPIATQARLLRVLESGEFLKVGSSKVLKTDVRVVAATNVNITLAIEKGKFREDLYYRLNTVPILVPPLRDRKPDIHLLFRKFATDFAGKYRMPVIKLDPEAENLLTNYYWQGNVRQLKNITEQISVIEKARDISASTLVKYLPQPQGSSLPMVIKGESPVNEFSERDILYKVLFDMKKDLTDLKKVVVNLVEHSHNLPPSLEPENEKIIRKIYQEIGTERSPIRLDVEQNPVHLPKPSSSGEDVQPHVVLEEQSLSLHEIEQEMIKKALLKHDGKRKNAARELGISERTLYRKLNEYGLDEPKK
jgi:transcriptional regulator with PAS, ATPase and Fis domain